MSAVSDLEEFVAQAIRMKAVCSNEAIQLHIQAIKDELAGEKPEAKAKPAA